MTPPRLDLSQEATRDLEDIEDWIADHDGEMRAAAVVERIRKTMDNLASMPGIGGRRAYLPSSQRAFSASPWTIFYRPLPESGIEVVRVIDERRDLPAVFRKNKPRR